MRNYYNKNKHCICGKLISNNAIKCKSCSRKGNLNPNFKNGLFNWKYYYEKNKTMILEKHRIYHNQKRIKDINFRIISYLRTRIYDALKYNRKSEHTIDLLGCSIKQLRQHLQSQFRPGMTWQNYGKWHIDHIRPCASFNLQDPIEQTKCFNYTNLQPLWAKDNLIKGGKNDRRKEKIIGKTS
jgi:hypothetical protein